MPRCIVCMYQMCMEYGVQSTVLGVCGGFLASAPEGERAESRVARMVLINDISNMADSNPMGGRKMKPIPLVLLAQMERMD